MSKQDFFDISLRKPVCIRGVNEDDLRALVDALDISVKDKNFGGFVLSSNGVEVKFNFGADGNFDSVTAKLNGKQIVIIPGNTSEVRYTFKGPPSSTNPGPGWETDAVLTQKYYNQPPNENDWEIFFAKRVNVLNQL